MTVRVCNNRSSSPLGVSGGRDHCGRIVAQGLECSINGWNSKADTSAKCGCSIGSKRVKLEDTSGKLGGEMLRPAAMAVPREPQTKTCVEGSSTRNVWRPKHNEVECDVAHVRVRIR